MAKILVLGAGGLIGQFVASDLMRRGYDAIAAARRFSVAQADLFGDKALQTPIASLDQAALQK